MAVVAFVNRAGDTRKLMVKRNQRNQYLTLRHCICCGTVFFAARAHAMYCSGACRQKMYRARRAVAKARHAEKLAQLNLC